MTNRLYAARLLGLVPRSYGPPAGPLKKLAKRTLGVPPDERREALEDEETNTEV
jgi:hypothetical protein